MRFVGSEVSEYRRHAAAKNFVVTWSSFNRGKIVELLKQRHQFFTLKVSTNEKVD